MCCFTDLLDRGNVNQYYLVVLFILKIVEYTDPISTKKRPCDLFHWYAIYARPSPVSRGSSYKDFYFKGQHS